MGVVCNDMEIMGQVHFSPMTRLIQRIWNERTRQAGEKTTYARSVGAVGFENARADVHERAEDLGEEDEEGAFVAEVEVGEGVAEAMAE